MMRTHTALHILCGTMFREYRKNLTKRRLFVSVSTSVFRSVTAADQVDYPALERSVQQWWEEHAVLQRYLHRTIAISSSHFWMVPLLRITQWECTMLGEGPIKTSTSATK